MENTKKIVVCSGGFDPLHSGHIKYLKAAKLLGDKLIVGVNSDAWLTRKKGRAFMPIGERRTIVANLKFVDETLMFDDSDGSAITLLDHVKLLYPGYEIIFANGGDRTQGNIPETVVKDVVFKFGVGGEEKANSSSWILEEWKAPKVLREWGYYRVLHTDGVEVKVKELTVYPGKSLSMQMHFKRNEFWFVSEGEATVDTVGKDGEITRLGTFLAHTHLHVFKKEWHRLSNRTDGPLKVIEIQYGEYCLEEDIVRKEKPL